MQQHNSSTIGSKVNKTAASNQAKKLSDEKIRQHQEKALVRMNNISGQVLIGGDVKWLYRSLVNGHTVQRIMSKADFASVLAGEVVPDDNGDWRALAPWFMRHPDRMIYEEVIFDPARFRASNGNTTHVYDPDEPNRAALNLFTGFAFSAKNLGSCHLFYDHLRHNYANGDPATEKTVLDWMAHLIQRPGVPIGWALAVVGQMGSGKSVVSDVLATIIGKDYCPVFTTPDQMLGKFNSALGRCLLARVEEAFNPRDPRHISTLKNILSGGDTLLELKGIDAIPTALRANVIFTSNSDHFLTAGTQGERRYFVFRCGNRNQQDGAYFKAMRAQLEKGGYSKLLYDLKHRDISQVDFTSPPRTAMLSVQIRHSLSGLERWWADCLEAGELIFARTPAVLEPLGWDDWESVEADAIKALNRQGPARPFSPTKALVLESAASYARDYAGRPPTLADIGKFMVNQAGAKVGRSRDGQQRVQRFVLPDVQECRRMFSEARPGLRIDDLGGSADVAADPALGAPVPDANHDAERVQPPIDLQAERARRTA